MPLPHPVSRFLGSLPVGAAVAATPGVTGYGSGSPSSGGGSGGSSSGGSTGTGGAPAATGGNPRTGGSGAGTGGVTATGGTSATDGTVGAGGSSGGASGSGGLGAGGSATGGSGQGPDAGAGGGPKTSCPAGVLLCDDFEAYATGAAPNGQWKTTTQGAGSAVVDTMKAYSGTKALHFSGSVNKDAAYVRASSAPMHVRFATVGATNIDNAGFSMCTYNGVAIARIGTDPVAFDVFQLSLFAYQSDPMVAQYWFDDVAVSTTRIGCPAAK